MMNAARGRAGGRLALRPDRGGALVLAERRARRAAAGGSRYKHYSVRRPPWPSAMRAGAELIWQDAYRMAMRVRTPEALTDVCRAYLRIGEAAHDRQTGGGPGPEALPGGSRAGCASGATRRR